MVAFLVPVVLAIGGRGIGVLLPVLAVPLARPLLRTVRTFGEPRQLNLVLKGTARLALIFGLLFGVLGRYESWTNGHALFGYCVEMPKPRVRPRARLR